jgi:CRISPR-associated protein Cas1
LARTVDKAKKRFLELLKDRFNSGVKHNGKTCKWDTVILNKTQELGRFLLDKSKEIDFIEPHPTLQRSDTQDLRKRILELTQGEAQKLGIGKSTLHYLRRSTSDGRPFKVYRKVLEKIELRP